MMKSEEIRKKFLEFFKAKGHQVIPSASLVPKDDTSTLFTSAGMQQLVPYLMGEDHPKGNKLVNIQRCVRTGDIDEVGDEYHLTFFEMMGYWSLGEYWKKEAIELIYEFLTKELGIDSKNFAVTCFEGDQKNNIPKDVESAEIWMSLGISKERIRFLGYKDNWWGPAGDTGPCGPDTELFVWTGKNDVPKKFNPDDDKWLELCNNVFMEYDRKAKTMLVDGMHCIYNDQFEIDDKVLETLDKFNARKIIVVKKHRKKAQEMLEGRGFEFFSLEEEDIGKDNLEYFHRLIDKFNINAKNLIYFDHKEESVKTAEKLGIVSEIYKDSVKLEEFVGNNIYRYNKLAQKNVDFGMGLERLLAYLVGQSDIFKTEFFQPIIEKIEEISGKKYQDNKRAFRIIVDHMKAATFIINEEIIPSNTKEGYILRRFIRRAVRYGKLLGIKRVYEVLESIYSIYSEDYIKEQNIAYISTQIINEEERFKKTLDEGLNKTEEIFAKKNPINMKLYSQIMQLEKKGEILKKIYHSKEDRGQNRVQREGIDVTSKQIKDAYITGKEAFYLYQSFGFPIEMIMELAQAKNLFVTFTDFRKELKKHQKLSRTASVGQFKGGLADAGEETKKLHTAAHLMLAALRKVLGDGVEQKGSNINAERLRFDFNCDQKLSDEQKKQVEDIVNEQIKNDLLVEMEEMSLDEAKKSGACGTFDERYGDKVKVYTIGDFSVEICGGPHVKKTGELGHFKIVKEQSSSAGVRRIKAILK